MKSMKRTLAVLVAVSLMIGCVIGGTLSWLTHQTPEVTNTFTFGDINIALDESKLNEDFTLDPTERVKSNSMKMIPGWTIPKDPKVTVEKNSEACWLFVQVEKSDNYDQYLKNYVIDDTEVEIDGIKYKWEKLLDDNDNNPLTDVYYRPVDTATAKTGTSYYVLKGEGTDANANGYVEVLDTVTKEMMNQIDGVIDENGTTTAAAAKAELDARPTLTFTAYAVQYYQDNNTPFAVNDAWAKVNLANQTTPTP